MTTNTHHPLVLTHENVPADIVRRRFMGGLEIPYSGGKFSVHTTGTSWWHSRKWNDRHSPEPGYLKWHWGPRPYTQNREYMGHNEAVEYLSSVLGAEYNSDDGDGYDHGLVLSIPASPGPFDVTITFIKINETWEDGDPWVTIRHMNKHRFTMMFQDSDENDVTILAPNIENAIEQARGQLTSMLSRLSWDGTPVDGKPVSQNYFLADVEGQIVHKGTSRYISEEPCAEHDCEIVRFYYKWCTPWAIHKKCKYCSFTRREDGMPGFPFKTLDYLPSMRGKYISQ